MKQDLEDFQIPVNLEDIRSKSKYSFKKEVKLKAKDLSMKILMKKKETHTKLDNLNYKELKMQSYLKLEGIKIQEIQDTFRFRTRMSKLGENYRGQGGEVLCPLCGNHKGNQRMLFHCRVLGEKTNLECETENIYSNEVNM